MTTPAVNPTMQAAKPFEPITILQPKPPAPSFASYPTPEWEKWRPGTERGEPLQQQQQQPSANGNSLWNIYNSLWKPNKPKAPSLFQNAIAKQPTYPYIRPQSEPMQTRMASAVMQYQNNKNQPFQAETSAYQLGFNNPPTANFIVSSNTSPGTYQGQLNALNNDEGSSFLFIDGKPYVIKRVINRFSNTFTPGNINIGRFQPFPRFGPGFMRGDRIPHVVRQALLDSPLPKTTILQNQVGNQRSSMRSPIAFPPQQLSSPPPAPQRAQQATVKILPQPAAASQRFHVIKPNYMQIYSNYLRSRGQLLPNQRSGQNDARSDTKQWHDYKMSPNSQMSNNQRILYNREPINQVPTQKQSVRAGSKYAISIKGIPGSTALAAIKNKAVTNPGFLSNLLSSRSYQYNHPSQPMAQTGPARKISNAFYHPFNKNKLNDRYAMLANLPQTDRALIRTKIIRPTIWGKISTDSSKTRTNIAYVPQSAFNRLPSWYRPKIGSALVKYVVKARDSPLTGFGIANKKQSLVHPAAKDVWQKIYSYYNRKNALQLKRMQNEYKERSAAILSSKRLNVGSKSASKENGMITNQVKGEFNVGSPLIRMRNYENPRNSKIANEMRTNEGFKLRMKTGINTFDRQTPNKEGAIKSVSSDMWDKRSKIESFLISKKNTIPHRPTIAGNWGTLKKKRSAFKQRQQQIKKYH